MDRRGSYISSQLTVINDKLQLLYDEIGIAEDERDSRERELYSAVQNALEQQVEDVTLEKQKLYDSCVTLKEQLTKMNVALQDVQEINIHDDDDLEIKPPLLVSYHTLKQRHLELQEQYEDRYKNVQELFKRLNEYASVMSGVNVMPDLLEKSADSIALTVLNMSLLQAEVQRLSGEYDCRIRRVQEDATRIVSLWAELGTSQHNIDRDILTYYKDSPDKLGLSNIALERLHTKAATLQQEKDNRLGKLSTTKSAVIHLWKKLSEEESMVKAFDRANRGISLPVIEAYEKELARLNEKKRDHMHIFIEDARQTLQRLWDSLYFSEDEMLDFTPAWTDIFTDASLAAHETEISRLEQLLIERKPILALIDAYRELQDDAIKLEQSQQDASRLLARGTGKRDPTRLLREEQMRKRIAKRKPRVMCDLMAALNKWEQETYRPFMVNGERFIDVLTEEEQSAKVCIFL
ncbi:microtubule associated protein-domain-containing protein [Lipomyces arxii]|uniref:microtubule associated protein-domain-containing protein n=1 Tax=Lipomyces arxii TaxID=56418 RepID=UPI0034CE770D